MYIIRHYSSESTNITERLLGHEKETLPVPIA